MNAHDKRSLSQLASPSRDGALRSGAKHARAYKSPFTILVPLTSDLPVGAMFDAAITKHLLVIQWQFRNSSPELGSLLA